MGSAQGVRVYSECTAVKRLMEQFLESILSCMVMDIPAVIDLGGQDKKVGPVCPSFFIMLINHNFYGMSVLVKG